MPWAMKFGLLEVDFQFVLDVDNFLRSKSKSLSIPVSIHIVKTLKILKSQYPISSNQWFFFHFGRCVSDYQLTNPSKIIPREKTQKEKHLPTLFVVGVTVTNFNGFLIADKKGKPATSHDLEMVI